METTDHCPSRAAGSPRALSSARYGQGFRDAAGRVIDHARVDQNNNVTLYDGAGLIASPLAAAQAGASGYTNLYFAR
jgi:hypothetical protein